uniref:Peroxin-7 n=2 Tax=Rhizochromulina marina TaxID=1034831 RepID=A0A7S2W0Y2_9STRA|mmetsp:Transcript_11026/g.31628  ORF Transcript_11026/g.31628 Transcript_11026/m.31628 type:complete len:262 (+) Transcript_11026:70-855(+)
MVAMEHHINDDGSERAYDEGFSLLTPHICQSAGQKGLVRKADVAGLGRSSSRAEDEDRATSPQPEKKARNHSSKLPPECEVEKGHVATLRSHSSEVFCCSWNPKFDLLATGSGDATARIWSMPEAASGSASPSPASSSPSSLCLVHDNPAKQAATAAAAAESEEAASEGAGDGEPNPDVNGDRDMKTAAATAAAAAAAAAAVCQCYFLFCLCLGAEPPPGHLHEALACHHWRLHLSLYFLHSALGLVRILVQERGEGMRGG